MGVSVSCHCCSVRPQCIMVHFHQSVQYFYWTTWLISGGNVFNKIFHVTVWPVKNYKMAAGSNPAWQFGCNCPSGINWGPLFRAVPRGPGAPQSARGLVTFKVYEYKIWTTRRPDRHFCRHGGQTSNTLCKYKDPVWYRSQTKFGPC